MSPGPSTTESDGLNWAYLRVSLATVAVGGVAGTGLALGLSAAGLTTSGGGFLWSAVLGGLALLAYLGATTAEPGMAGDMAAEPLFAAEDAHEKVDRGFHVSDAMLWVALGLLLAGIAGMASAF